MIETIRFGRNRIDIGWPTDPEYGAWRECRSHPDVDTCDEHAEFTRKVPKHKATVRRKK